VVDLLRRHGVVVERLGSDWRGRGETFTVDSVSATRNAFEGHRQVSVEGRWTAGELTARAGSWFVSTDQRLGVLAAYLLEPESEDGVVAWNFLDRDLRPRATYPVRRVHRPVPASLDVVP
jgi:hypothetical protein